jgi:SWI/SNF-related matrix-associated actin-dependent regulator of chromatin subfamily A-like protein 1
MVRVPDGLTLRDYQLKGVRHLLDGQKKLLLDDMGLGKTAQSVVAFNTLGAKVVLIICPPAVKYGWQRELSVWSTRDYNVQVLEGTMAKIEIHSRMVVVCPDSIVTSPFVLRQLLSIKWGATIVDEVHRFKSMDAKRTKAVMAKKGIIGNSVYFWGLSGTLMPNTPKDLIVPFLSMGKKHIGKYDDWFKFTGRYCKRFKSGYGWDISGASNLDELSNRLFKTGFAIMRHKTDVLHELPAKQYRLLPVKGGSLSVEAQELLGRADIQKETLGLNAGELAIIRREVGEAKVKSAVEYIDSVLESVSTVVVFAWHKDVVESLALGLARAGHSSSVYYGAMTAKQKEESKADFTSGKTQVFIANIASGGTGLDGLQHIASHAVFVECPWTYTEIAQASDRIHRFGQKNKVTVDLLVLQDQVEHYIVGRVLEKEAHFNQTFKRTETLTGE